MSHIGNNYRAVWRDVADAAVNVGRDPNEIMLIAVSKNFPPSAILEAVAAGALYLGENRVQEMVDKFQQLGAPAHWHLIGHLQTNKVRHALPVTDWIHSLDRISLAEEIEKRAAALAKRVNVLIEVNVAEEDSKQGVDIDGTVALIKDVARFAHLHVRGLMTIAPYVDEPEEVRWVFRRLRQLRDEISAMQLSSVDMHHLSMGMSGDFKVAIEEGSTMVRIGSAIFGQRQYEQAKSQGGG
jgi:hypothetical protein